MVTRDQLLERAFPYSFRITNTTVVYDPFAGNTIGVEFDLDGMKEPVLLEGVCQFLYSDSGVIKAANQPWGILKSRDSGTQLGVVAKTVTFNGAGSALTAGQFGEIIISNQVRQLNIDLAPRMEFVFYGDLRSSTWHGVNDDGLVLLNLLIADRKDV